MDDVVVPLGQRQGLPAVGRGQDAVASTGEHPGDEIPQAVFILGDENGLACGRVGGRDRPAGVNGLVAGGKVQVNGGAAARQRVDDQFTAGLLDDAVGGSQAEAGALAERLGGEERLHGLQDRGGRHSVPRVGD